MWLANCSECIEHDFKFYQSNHEGDIIDFIHDERHWTQGIIINPGAFAHYSYAIMDAIKSVNIPTVEVHITDVKKRDNFRKKSVIAPVCVKQISGLGKYSYLEGVKELI
jgi:3-dehydroquinate dehydratase-2